MIAFLFKVFICSILLLGIMIILGIIGYFFELGKEIRNEEEKE